MLRFLPPFALLLCGLAACTSTSPNELYNHGQALEIEGHYEEAVDHYIRALEREPDMRKAQGRLRVVGSELVDGHLAQARMASFVEAADAYLLADALVQRAAAVGVNLRVPATFADDRDGVFAAAHDVLLQDARTHYENGAYDAALGLVAQAEAYPYGPDDTQMFLYDVAFSAGIAWAEEGLATGQFRAAYARAEVARTYGSHSEDSGMVDQLVERILEAGSVTVAVFPVEAGDAEARSDLPRGFAAEFEDRLEDEHWFQPPLFVRMLELGEVRRFLRGERDTDALFGRVSRVGRFTDRLEADLGVAMQLGHLIIEERETDRDTLSAPLRRGEGTGQYVRIEQRRTLDGTAQAVVVGSDGRVVCRERVSAEVAGRLRTGRVLGRGDPSLVIPSRDRDLFDERTLREAERELERDLQGDLAARLGARVFACVSAQVP